jgi:hypothetical protein
MGYVLEDNVFILSVDSMPTYIPDSLINEIEELKEL